MRVRYDWTEVQRFYDQGHERKECMARFGFSSVGWYKAIQRGCLRAEVSSKRYNWAAVQRHYDEGHTFRECRARFGFAAESWAKASRRGDIRARPQRWPIEKVLTEAKCRNTVKRHLIEAGILNNVC